MATSLQRKQMRVRLAAVLGAGALVLAACGSSKSAGSAPTGAKSASSAATAGLSPILVGVGEQTQGAGNLASDMNPGLTGGLYYVNSVLGGVHGHPLKLVHCSSDGTPADEVLCANKFVSDHVVAVFDDYDFGFASEHPILARAGIPIFGVEAADFADEDSPAHDTWFGPPEQAFAVGPLQIFHQQGINRISLTLENAPSSVQYVNGAIDPVAQKLGMSVHVVYYPASSPNWSVISASLLSYHPQLTGIIAGPESVCDSLISALRSSGFNGPLLMGSCSQYVTADPSGAVNTYSYSAGWLPGLKSAAPPATVAQIDAYDSAMAKVGYSDTDSLGQWAVNSFSGLVDLQHALEGGSPPYTPTSVRSDLEAVSNYLSFMGPMDTCNNNQWPGTASCNHALLLVKVGPHDRYSTVAPGGFASLNPSL